MKTLIRLLQWTLKAAVFFTLFAFALNNTQDTDVQFFFGYAWSAPLILVVLAAFTAGVAIGVLGMVPRWWRHKRTANKLRSQVTATPPAPITPSFVATYDDKAVTTASKNLK